jgi:hypothetical protein
MSAFDRLISELERAECNPRKFHGGWRAQCPSHGSKGGTLKVTEIRDGVLFHCFAGCEADEVLGSLGLSWRDLRGEHFVPSAPRKKKPKREPVWRDPVMDAARYGVFLRSVGDRVFVGSCPCGGDVIAGPGGCVCSNDCPVGDVGRLLRDWTDSGLSLEGARVDIRTLNVLGCTEKKRGTSKHGNEYVIYQVFADDGNGNKVEHELTSFSEIPTGVGEYLIERDENQWGVRYTIKRPNGMARQIIDLRVELRAELAAIRAEAGLAPKSAAPAPVAPPAPAPVVVESSEVPF